MERADFENEVVAGDAGRVVLKRPIRFPYQFLISSIGFTLISLRYSLFGNGVVNFLCP